MYGTLPQNTGNMIRPIGNNILIQIDEAQSVSDGGIHTPETSRPVPRNATVIRVGTGRVTKKGIRVPIECKPGDRIYLGIGERKEVTESGHKLHLMSAEYVEGIVTT